MSSQVLTPPGRLNGPRWHRWWIAARPRTLTMAVAPVVAGSALAAADGATLVLWVFLATAACAALIQAGTNLLNDAIDFERGNDRPDRVGPLRITAAGLATPREVKRAAALAFGAALVVGVALVAIGGLPILAIGLGSIVAGWAYSGGGRPVSHGVWGEVFVFVFFGVVAVAGTYFLQAGAWSGEALATGVALGAIAAAVLLLNNYRDLATDAAAGRRTLAAVLGPARARLLYAGLMLAPLALPAWLWLREPTRPGVWLACLALPLLLGCVLALWRTTGPALNAVLGRTALAQLAFALLLGAGLLI